MLVLTGGQERTEEEYALVRERRTAADERGSGRVPLWHRRRCAELVPRIEAQKEDARNGVPETIGLRIGVHVGPELCVPYPTQIGCESEP
jgi:hypothetical protein